MCNSHVTVEKSNEQYKSILKLFFHGVPFSLTSIKQEKPPSISSSESTITLLCFSCNVEQQFKLPMNISKQNFFHEIHTEEAIIHVSPHF